jgi:hypothetical protein
MSFRVGIRWALAVTLRYFQLLCAPLVTPNSLKLRKGVISIPTAPTNLTQGQ